MLLPFGGPTAAAPGECAVDLSWDAATGEPPILYEVLRDGIGVTTVSATSWTDTVSWGGSHVYQVRAEDACASGPREGLNEPSAPVSPTDPTPPAVPAPAVTVQGPCTVRVDTAVTDACSGPDPAADVLRDGVPAAVAVPLPHDDTVPKDGTYSYQVHGYDRAGNGATSGATPVAVDTCGRCVYRKACPARVPGCAFDPAGRDPVTDVAFTEPERSVPHACPLRSGELDPDPAAGAPLVFYQVEGAGLDGLRLARDPASGGIRIFY